MNPALFKIKRHPAFPAPFAGDRVAPKIDLRMSTIQGVERVKCLQIPPPLLV